MDGSTFDRLSRLFATAGSRRGILGMLSGLPLAELLLSRNDATARPGRKHHRHQTRSHQQRSKRERREDAHGEACIPTGQRCPAKKARGKKGKKLSCDKCCQGSFVTEGSGKKVCGCQPNGGACTPATAASCCSGFCDGSTCQAAPCSAAIPCPQCQSCNASTGLCEAAADGTTCDDGNACTEIDTCQGGVCAGTPINCPAGQTCQGGVCGVGCGSDFCPTATEICDGGTCQACDVCSGAGVCTYTSIQAAINATPQLQTIRVCAGTYLEDSGGPAAVDIGRDLTLIGAGDGNDPLSDTIVRPQLANRIVMQASVSLGLITVTVRALRITGGTGDIGSGLTLSRSHATVDSCTIIDNHPTFSGGGGILIAFDTSQVSLINTHVTGNSSRIGGGILVDEAQLTLDEASRVAGNEATGGPSPSGTVFGGGIWAESGASVFLPSADNVTGNTPNNCRVDTTGGSFSGPGAVCTST